MLLVFFKKNTNFAAVNSASCHGRVMTIMARAHNIKKNNSMDDYPAESSENLS